MALTKKKRKKRKELLRSIVTARYNLHCLAKARFESYRDAKDRNNDLDLVNLERLEAVIALAEAELRLLNEE